MLQQPSAPKLLHPLFLSSLLALLAACGSSKTEIEGPLKAAEDSGAAKTKPPLYLAASWVTDADTTNTYLSIFDSLDIERLDFNQALEVPGWGDAWVYEDGIFVADGDSPTVKRYSLDADGELKFREGDQVSFLSYGVSGAAFWDQQFLSPTKAYFSHAAGREYIVWNPKTMEITGTVAWPPLSFGEGLTPINSYTDRGGVVVNGKFFHGLYGHDADWTAFGESSVVAVYDIKTDALLASIEVPCPMMDVATLGDDGYLYVSGWSYIPLSYLAGYSKKNCAARIDVTTLELDASWTLDYSQVTGGDQGSALRAVSGTEGVLAVFHGSGVPVSKGMDIWDLDVADNDWELYSIDLSTKAATPTGIKMGDGSYYESHIDDGYFVYLSDGLADTQVYERTRSGYQPKLKAAGWMSRLFRVR